MPTASSPRDRNTWDGRSNQSPRPDVRKVTTWDETTSNNTRELTHSWTHVESPRSQLVKSNSANTPNNPNLGNLLSSTRSGNDGLSTNLNNSSENISSKSSNPKLKNGKEDLTDNSDKK